MRRQCSLVKHMHFLHYAHACRRTIPRFHFEFVLRKKGLTKLITDDARVFAPLGRFNFEVCYLAFYSPLTPQSLSLARNADCQNWVPFKSFCTTWPAPGFAFAGEVLASQY